MSTQMNIVELPDDTVPAFAAPEIAGLASRAIQEKPEYRLLANTLARQWWGVATTPASLNDAWITEGLARYSEARYVEHAAGPQGFEEASKDMAVGALAYDTIPMNSLDRMPVFSPEFQSLATDKGAMIFNMLRWTLGDAPYDRAIRELYAANRGKKVDRASLQAVAEKNSGGQNLTWFFTQWLDSSGAPEFKNKYTVYRTKSGFRVVGEISQDLDLFRMPVELRIDTDGKSEMKRIEVVGTNSPYAVETFGKPRRISIDPDSRVLKNSPDLRVRVSILRGQQLVAQGDLAEALREFQKALDVNKDSSLAHYRIADVFFLQRNYQAAANAYRQAADGDREPRWTEVWSYIQLGRIFDITGQRERAVNEYRKALNTNDNTQGALEQARKCLQTPCGRDEATSAQKN
jgi:aminopeptidase N